MSLAPPARLRFLLSRTGAILPILKEFRCVNAWARPKRISGIPVAPEEPKTIFPNNQRERMMAMDQSLDVLRRVKGEYLEMPGLRLTIAQAQRLWGLDRAVCDALLGALVETKFLFRTRDGAFVRADHAVGTS